MSLKDRLLDPTSTSKFGYAGQKGPEFENAGRANFSEIHALTNQGALNKSQDLLSGRLSTQCTDPQGHYFKPASEPPVSFPDGNVGKAAPWGPYSSKGPVDGRY